MKPKTSDQKKDENIRETTVTEEKESIWKKMKPKSSD